VLVHQAIVDRGRIWALRCQLGLLALGWLVSTAPLLAYFAQHPERYVSRTNTYGLFQSGRFSALIANGAGAVPILLDQLRASFGAFLLYNDSSPFYAPDMPLLDPFSAVLFLIGLVLLIKNWRRMENMLVLFWVFGAAFFGSAMLVDPPQSPRFVTTAPALCLLVVMGLEPLQSALRRYKSTAPFRWAALTILLVLLGLWNLNFYFRVYTPRNAYGGALEVTRMAYYLRDHAQDAAVYFVGAPILYLDHPTLRFIAGSIQGQDVLQPMQQQDVPAIPAGKRALFLFTPERNRELIIVQERFPRGVIEEHRENPDQGKLLFITYEIEK
jgi:hypothetical protein